ncbi:hypothetical protein ACQY0O_004809 [Thecaphora frezii]
MSTLDANDATSRGRNEVPESHFGESYSSVGMPTTSRGGRAKDGDSSGTSYRFSSQGAAKAKGRTKSERGKTGLGSEGRPNGGMVSGKNLGMAPSVAMREALLQKIIEKIRSVARSEEVLNLSKEVRWVSDQESQKEEFDDEVSEAANLAWKTKKMAARTDWEKWVLNKEHGINIEGMRVFLKHIKETTVGQKRHTIFQVLVLDTGNRNPGRTYFGRLSVPRQLTLPAWFAQEKSASRGIEMTLPNNDDAVSD